MLHTMRLASCICSKCCDTHHVIKVAACKLIGCCMEKKATLSDAARAKAGRIFGLRRRILGDGSSLPYLSQIKEYYLGLVKRDLISKEHAAIIFRCCKRV